MRRQNFYVRCFKFSRDFPALFWVFAGLSGVVLGIASAQEAEKVGTDERMILKDEPREYERKSVIDPGSKMLDKGVVTPPNQSDELQESKIKTKIFCSNVSESDAIMACQSWGKNKRGADKLHLRCVVSEWDANIKQLSCKHVAVGLLLDR